MRAKSSGVRQSKITKWGQGYIWVNELWLYFECPAHSFTSGILTQAMSPCSNCDIIVAQSLLYYNRHNLFFWLTNFQILVCLQFQPNYRLSRNPLVFKFWNQNHLNFIATKL